MNTLSEYTYFTKSKSINSYTSLLVFNWVLSKKQKKASKKGPQSCQNLSVENKNKKHKCACERYRNLSEEEKNKKCQHCSKRI